MNVMKMEWEVLFVISFILCSFSIPIDDAIYFLKEKSIQDAVENRYVNNDYTPHPPIIIEGNYDFTPENGVVAGNGTKDNPYIIEGWKINAKNATGIKIVNTDAYFIIRNCYIYDGIFRHDGIIFENVENGVIENVCIINNNNGMFFNYSSNNTIRDCYIYSNILWYGIYFIHSTNNIVLNCSISNNWGGIKFSSSKYNTVSNCDIISNHVYGIWLSSKLNTICYCNIQKNEYGIKIDSSNNVVFCSNISDNENGLFLYYSSNNTVYNCEFINDGLEIDGDYMKGKTHFIHNIYNNTVNGRPLLYYKNENNLILDEIEAGQVIIVGCNESKIKNVNVKNAVIGIQIIYSKKLEIFDCIISENKEGIRFFRSFDCKIYDCQFIKNKYAINLLYSSNNKIHDCLFANNSQGICVISSNNEISNCKLTNNKCGIYCWSGEHHLINRCNFSGNHYSILLDTAHFNTIQYNQFIGNDFGIYLNDAFSNIIECNNFIDNSKDATFDIFLLYLIYSPNKWDGNYWSNWQRILPKPISGYASIPIGIIPPTSLKIYWFNFDWHPSLKPIA